METKSDALTRKVVSANTGYLQYRYSQWRQTEDVLEVWLPGLEITFWC